MNIMKKSATLAALSAIILAVTPVNAAWVFDPNSDYTVTVVSTDGKAKLAVGCDWVGALYFTINTGETYDTTASYAVTVPMTVTADGAPFEISATFQNIDGMLFVDVDERHGSGVAAAILAFERATDPIQIAFFQTRLSFPAENARAVGRVIDTCYE